MKMYFQDWKINTIFQGLGMYYMVCALTGCRMMCVVDDFGNMKEINTFDVMHSVKD